MVALFIINPVAGKGEQQDIQQKVMDYCTDHDLTCYFLETTGENDSARIRNALKTYAPDIAFACGGDGTVSMLGTVLRGTSIAMGIIPRGSANGLATELGLPYNVHDCLDVLLSSHRLPLDSLIINDNHDCFHLADVGYNAKLIHTFEKLEERGKLGYAKGFLRTMRQRTTATMTYTCPKGKKTSKVIMAVFANARMYGTGAIINPEGRLNDGKFELILFQPWPRWYFLFLAFLSLVGRIKTSRYVKSISLTKVTVALQTPLPLQIDGEPIGMFSDLTVRISDEKVLLAVPASYFLD